MDQIIAYCGINCTECEAYQATQAGDDAAKERIAEQWRQNFQSSGIDARYVSCDGCTVLTGRTCGYCKDCAVRSCAMEHKVVNCAHCPEYTCATLEGFLAHAPQLREALDAIRQSL